MHARALAPFALFAALAAAGCSSPPAMVGECTSASDCSAGESCVDNVCVPRGVDGGLPPDAGGGGCRSDAECSDGVACTTDVCDTTGGTCSHIPDHAMCPAGALCEGAAGCVPGRACTTPADCDDGIHCNGEETCVVERCAPGTAVDCNDSIACTIDVCDEGADTCEHLATDARCDDGMYCTGVETCNATTGCVTTPPPACDDGLDCTVDACDEAIDGCGTTVSAGSCEIDGACVADGTTDGADFCRTCDAAADGRAWTVSCTGSVGDDTFDDFRAGSLGHSAANLYVHAGGSVQSVHRSDIDRDGFPDAVLSNYFNGTTRRIASQLLLGSATGLDPARPRVDLPTIGALGSITADLDADGFVDVVFANHHNDTGYATDSYVYWGSATGHSTMDRTSLATLGAYEVETADLDRDGWLDLVFMNYYDGTRYNTTSFVYWGSPTGFSAADRLSLPTEGAIDVCIADLDGDENLEVVTVGYYNCASSSCAAAGYTSARVRTFRGTPTGPDVAAPTHVPALGGRGCAIADIDADGDLDLYLANHYNGTTGFVDSRILWGDPAMPWDITRTYAFPTAWASRGTIADVDGNGFLDIVTPLAYGGSYTTSSRVYYRGATGVILTDFFPTVGSYDVEVLDWNGDGRLDLFYGGHYNGTSYAIENRLYVGADPRPPTSAPLVFPGQGMLGMRSHDWGNTWDRSWVESFTSRPLDMGAAVTPTWIDGAASVPAGTILRLQVRSAPDAASLAAAPWLGPTSAGDFYTTFPVRLNAAHAGHQFVQYRAELEMPNGAGSPVLDQVRIHYL